MNTSPQEVMSSPIKVRKILHRDIHSFFISPIGCDACGSPQPNASCAKVNTSVTAQHKQDMRV